MHTFTSNDAPELAPQMLGVLLRNSVLPSSREQERQAKFPALPTPATAHRQNPSSAQGGEAAAQPLPAEMGWGQGEGSGTATSWPAPGSVRRPAWL